MTDFSYQLYSSRKAQSLSRTLSMLAQLGLRQVEGYGALVADADARASLTQALADEGLSMTSTHAGLETLRHQQAELLSLAPAVGLQAVFVPFLATDDRPHDADGWRAFGQELARLGAPFVDAGLKFGWHNHDFEFHPLADGSFPIEHLAAVEGLALELDVAWIFVAGQDPDAWLERLRPRIAALHVKDRAPAGANVQEDGWADVGDGVLDWARLLREWPGQLPTLVLEHDNPSDDERFARRSSQALKALLATRRP